MQTEEESGLATDGAVLGVFAGPIRALRSAREPGGTVSAWRSAILKDPIGDAIFVGPLGLTGDAQKEKKHHGGPTKAVLIYGTGHYQAIWDQRLQPHARAHAAALRTMSPQFDASVYGLGAFGENLAISGLTEQRVCLGDVWQIGDCRLRITEPRGPCATLTRRWMRPTLVTEVKESAAAGWYNAVEQPGAVAPGDSATLVDRTQDEWTLEKVFHLLEQRVVRREDVLRLCDAACTHDGLRERLQRRLRTPGRTVG